VNFTREPIIESIISARDGFKLSIRSTKIQENREILVDAVEIVSFGNSHFFRCQEKPKPFFFPVGDYEVSEVKETRFILKNSTPEKSVKIQSSKEHLHKTAKELPEEEILTEEEEISEEPKEELTEDTSASSQRDDKKSKRNRRKRDRQKQQRFTPTDVTQEEVSTEGDKGGDTKDEALVSSPTSIAPKFITPPPALIISALSHRKSEAVHQEPLLPTSPLEVTEVPLQEIQLNPSDEIHSLSAGSTSRGKENTSLESSKEV
jgi:hypothetical protein